MSVFWKAKLNNLVVGLLVLLTAGCASIGGHIKHAEKSTTSGNIDAAITAYYRALEQQPKHADVSMRLARVLEKKGLADEAVRILEQAQTEHLNHQELQGQLADTYFRQGKQYRDAGKISDAFETWQKTLKLQPGHMEANAQLARLYSDQGEDDKAAAQYQKITKNHPRDLEARRSLGLVYFKQGKYEEAVSQFQQVLRLKPQDAQVYNNLGSVYLKVGRLDDAIVAFEQAISLDPNLSVAHNNWGTAFYKQGRYQRARQEWELALKLDQKNATARRNLNSLAALGY